MKKLFVTMMMLATVLMCVSCSKSDDGGSEVPTSTDPTTQAGTWISTNQLNEVELAMTFDNADNVLINLEGLWFFGTMERHDGHLTMTGSQIDMRSFTDFGTFTAKVLPLTIVIDCDYKVQASSLVISNISIKPNMMLSLKSSYWLRFDKVYKGESMIF